MVRARSFMRTGWKAAVFPLLLLMLPGATSSCATLTGASSPVAIALPGDRLYPESVSISPDGMAYIGSVTGGVLRVALATGVVTSFIAPGAFGSGSLFGVLADPGNHLLWICSNNFTVRGVRVAGEDPGTSAKAFDLETGAGRFTLPFDGASPRCNDFAAGADGSVYMTDTAVSHILRWRPGDRKAQLWLADPRLKDAVKGGGLDGLAFGDDGALYVNNVQNGALFRIEINGDAPGKVTRLTLSRPLDAPDGMRRLPDGRFIVAEGAGRVTLLTVQGDRVLVQTIARDIDRQTGVDAYKGVVWYVQGMLSSVFHPEKVARPPLPFVLTPVHR